MHDEQRDPDREHDEAVAEISRIEAQIITGIAPETTRLDAALEIARADGDGAFEGRVRCLYARALLMQGRNEDARTMAGHALSAFERLDPVAARRYAGLHAEAFRAAGTALSKLGRIAEALEQLEAAVRIAQAGVDEPALPAPQATCISAQSALLRSLMALGIALFFLRELDASIDAYRRAMATSEAYPDIAAHFIGDVLLVRWNFVEALHQRARRRSAADDRAGAQADLAAAKHLIDSRNWRFEERAAIDLTEGEKHARPVAGASGRAAYYGALTEHLLLTGEPVAAYAAAERQLAEIELVDYDLGIATAQVNLAQAALALESPRAALEHTDRALAILDHHDESATRAAVLRERAQALYDLGEYQAAFRALSLHHELRGELEAVAALHYARRMTAKLELERALAEAQAHRRVAEMLETLGTIAQEITASLDAATIVRILATRLESLLGPVAPRIWLVDPSGERLGLVWEHGAEAARDADDIALADPRSLPATVVRERCEPRATLKPGGAQAVLVAPLLVADRALGAIAIEANRSGGFTTEQQSIFRTLNAYAAIAIDNAGAYAKLEQLSLTDALTGIANRRALTERAQLEIAARRQHGGPLSVIMFDIDHFKGVNDTFGHAGGDSVLTHIAQVAKRHLRPSDLLARMGGEEFAVLLDDTNVEEACAIAERVRARIAESPVIWARRRISVTCSFGVAPFDDACTTIDDALERADTALYLAKAAGRDAVRVVPASTAAPRSANAAEPVHR